MMKKVLFLLLVFSGNILPFSFGQELSVIPLPNEMTIDNREPGFSINANTTLIADKSFLKEAVILSDYLREVTKLPALRVTHQKAPSSGFIELKAVAAGKIPAEGYQISVQQKSIQISASDPAGAFYGCMTLLQLVRKNSVTGKFTIPAAGISDQPRFGWRGLMLDCSRTFIPVSYLKKTIDRMSFYKLNTLHLHLTDDQGWRLEIKKYPLLTQKGAFFDKKYNEPAEFQGYYTQAQMKELVKYAAERHITIIPEIEFPGHNHAALYAYPEFSCTGKSTPVYPFFSGIHITSSVFCPANPKTYTFMKDVIAEVSEIFPASYIHLGGDEVPKGVWDNCAGCKALMDSLHLKSQHELQGYMMNRTGNDVLSQRRRPIGWDEIFSGGVNKDWVIMNWRNAQTALDAVRAGYDVILATRTNLYFDYDYNTTPTEKVYAYDPIPENTTDEDRKHYLGIQACFWSHIDRTQSRFDFQLYPRTLALAERAWSPARVNNYEQFDNRMKAHQFWLDYFGIIKRY